MEGKIHEVLDRVDASNPIIISIAGNLSSAMQTLKHDRLVKSISIRDKNLLITYAGSQKEESALLRRLIEAGVPVRGFHREKGDLESLFLQLTGAREERRVNGGLSILILINLFYIVSTAELTGEIAYQSFLRIYYIAALLELLLVLLLAPALAASSVASERDQRSLGLLLTTQLTPTDIIIGKLMSVMSTLMLLVATALPIFATVYIYGGITFFDILMYLLTAFVCALLSTSIGILVSVSIYITTAATLVSYAGMTLCILAALLFVQFRGRFGISGVQAYVIALLFLVLLSLLALGFSTRQLKPHPVRRKV